MPATEHDIADALLMINNTSVIHSGVLRPLRALVLSRIKSGADYERAGDHAVGAIRAYAMRNGASEPHLHDLFRKFTDADFARLSKAMVAGALNYIEEDADDE